LKSILAAKVKMICVRTSLVRGISRSWSFGFITVLKRLSADDKTRLAYEAREKAIRDELAKIKGAYLKGELNGKQQTQLEIAKNLLAEGSTPNFIAKVSGLSLEEIQVLEKG
jgi:predicted transposase/invertase (TIGR01784 family)